MLSPEERRLIITETVNMKNNMKGTSKNDAIGVKLDVSRGLPDSGQA